MIEVNYVDHMGTDLSIVNAARVSMGKRKSTFDERDRALLAYLSKHGHWTPFSHATVSVHAKVPIFVERQIFKHVVGFTYNSISGRYVSMELGFWEPEYWRKGSASIKQGSLKEEVSFPSLADAAYGEAIAGTERAYRELLKLGVCKEQARAVLPLSTLTEFFATGTLYAWARLYKLRTEEGAQAETTCYAHKVGAICSEYFPNAWEALINKED